MKYQDKPRSLAFDWFIGFLAGVLSALLVILFGSGIL